MVVVIQDGDRLRAVAPLCLQDERRFGVKIRVLRFFGSGEVCADHLDLLVEAEFPEGGEKIWGELFGPLRKEWDIFECFDMRSESPALRSFESLARSGRRFLKYDVLEKSICPYCLLPASWDEYLAGCSGTRRYSITYSMRKLGEQGKLTRLFCEKPEELDAYLDEFIALHQRSWNARGQPGAFASKKFEEFHRRVARSCLDKGWLFLYAFHLDGRHIGSLYGFQYAGTVYYYLAAVEINPVKKVKTGVAILGGCLEEAIRRGCQELDLLRGDEDYKYGWTATHRRNPRIRLYNRTPAGAAVLAAASSSDRAKRTLKKALGKSRIAALKQMIGAKKNS